MDYTKKYVEELIRKQCEELEEQAAIFVKMGYELKELTVVCHQNGDKEVAPLSALQQEK